MVFFSFDYNSIFERKNPLAAVKAFKKFAVDHEDAVFVLKTSNLHHYYDVFMIDSERLIGAAAGARIIIINDTLTHSEMEELYDRTNCYVSLLLLFIILFIYIIYLLLFIYYYLFIIINY